MSINTTLAQAARNFSDLGADDRQIEAWVNARAAEWGFPADAIAARLREISSEI